MHVKVFVCRNDLKDGVTVPTIVEADVSDIKVPDIVADTLCRRIYDAVTEWSKTSTISEIDQSTLDYACGDFNIGDLSQLAFDDPDHALCQYLKKHGVENLQIRSLEDGETHHGWTYDSSLIAPCGDED